ncbi:hypothetical protein Q2T40_21085 [Winogradskyella maritima]|nr:hypothetical protein [Winogradskyella maritima]
MGTLHAIDLIQATFSGAFLREYPGVRGRGNWYRYRKLWGPIVTENGLLLIAGTRDGFLGLLTAIPERYFGNTSCPLLLLPLRATYEFEGKQYIVLACGGESWELQRE